jgi:hypothetical protein
MTAVQKGEGRCQAPSQKCNETVTNRAFSLQSRAGELVPGTVTEVQQTIPRKELAL